MIISDEKKILRRRLRELRAAVDPVIKKAWDKKIARHIMDLDEYKSCRLFLCYLPLPGEIDTVPLIEDALLMGKAVAAPYCVPGGRALEFYRIESLSTLREGSYGTKEPEPKEESRVDFFEGALCLLPGLAFDKNGYRLGYGGGYYDRFLAKAFAGGIAAGACYSSFLMEDMIRDKYDLPCNILVTEEDVYRINLKTKRA